MVLSTVEVTNTLLNKIRYFQFSLTLNDKPALCGEE